ncbi:MAG: hypothetical protein HQ507_10390 [Candidatus Marinimicrobia bacterium]|nr:hypothetical protein [Candidatus Neomarinimicrobiota bacterium]
MPLRVFAFIILAISGLLNPVFAQLEKATIDDYDNTTIVGEMGLTVTNFGILGEGWNNPDQASCRYKQYGTEREMVELMSYAGLWIGGIPVIDGIEQLARSSTAIVDGAFDSGEEGFEFTARSSSRDTIRTRSSISSRSDSPLAAYFSTEAISQQDLLADFDDFRFPARIDTIKTSPTYLDTLEIMYPPNHIPLGIKVHLESYAWSFSFMESFVILDYTITNRSDSVYVNLGDSVSLVEGGWDLKNLFVGLWADASVNNMNFKSKWENGSGFSWYDNINSFERSYSNNGFPRNIGYQYDYDGDEGWSQAYFGLMALYGPNRRSTFYGDNQGDWFTYYNQWQWTDRNRLVPEFDMPVNDTARYTKLSSSAFYDDAFRERYRDQKPWLDLPNSWMMLVSAGPFGTQSDGDGFVLPVGESINVVFAVIGAPWSHQGTNNDLARRQDLIQNADWAQKAFNGEDVNGNSVLDPGEDFDGDGVLDRYIVPEPPPSPSLAVVAEDQSVTLYWDNASESTIDPVSRKQDFAGYRIYGSAKTQGNSEQYSLLAEFDLIGDEFGYDTGFDLVRITDEFGLADSLEIKGHYYHYKWVNQGVQNGWPGKTVYAITAYDSGDEATGLESLESSRNENRISVIPGTPAPSHAQNNPVSVYPNPYRVSAKWDGGGQRDRLIWFRNLPENSLIRIFTLSGDLVEEIEHEGNSYTGGDVTRLPAGNTVLSGGEHPWDLISKFDEPIATGMYVYSVENLNTNTVQIGKFLVIK